MTKSSSAGTVFQSTPLCEGRQLLCYQIDLLVVLGCLALTVVVGLGLIGICCLHEGIIKLFQWSNQTLTFWGFSESQRLAGAGWAPLLAVAWALALELENKRVAQGVGGGFAAVVLYFAPRVTAEVIKAQAVAFRVVEFEQFGFERYPLRWG